MDHQKDAEDFNYIKFFVQKVVAAIRFNVALRLVSSIGFLQI